MIQTPVTSRVAIVWPQKNHMLHYLLPLLMTFPMKSIKNNEDKENGKMQE